MSLNLNQNGKNERFSLLLLEPNEIYFEDFSVDCIIRYTNSVGSSSSKDKSQAIGHLKICSKSLVFDPKDSNAPLIKLKLTDCLKINDSTEFTEECSHEVLKEFKFSTNCLIIQCSQSINMLKNNIIAPYEFIRNTGTTTQLFIFKFHYCKIEDNIGQIQQLKRASSLPASQGNAMISTIVFSRHNRMKFNLHWLNNIYEKILYDCKVDEISPLVCNPGRLQLTSSHIYFQPYNNILPYPVIKIRISSIQQFTKRRYLLRHIGIEIIWKDDEYIPKEHNLYVAFRNLQERNEFCDFLKNESEFNLADVKPESITLKWQNRLISNYDYLLYLNSLADRTFKDLTQYPVFPWILTDYTSKSIDLQDDTIYRDLRKPIGAVNESRLQRLIERSAEMSDLKYLYGSHYSTPGFVLFYLVRKFPELMLCLQNGKFDHPDRMFNKMSDTFQNCMNNMSDFKELIPEFYDPQSGRDFLINVNKINFGIRSDGRPVSDVELPPWAKNSPEKFIQTLRDALESDYVSLNIHHWIDLIFGYKQRGNEAIKANNVFHHMCYEGAIDLDSIKDGNTRHAYQVQISEFGQIPKQIFCKPHVSRMHENNEAYNSPIKVNHQLEVLNKTYKLNLITSYIAHKDKITSICLDDDIIASTGKDGVLKFFSIDQNRQISSVTFTTLALSSCVKIPNSNVYAVGSWDNTISLYNRNYGKITDEIPAHDDSVSCLNIIENLGLLISGGSDCCVKLWKGFDNVDYKNFRISDAMISYLPLEDNITCLTSRQFCEKLQIVIGTESGDIFLWTLPLRNLGRSSDIEPELFLHHDKAVNCVQFDVMENKLASCCENGVLLVTDIETGMNLMTTQLDSNVECLAWCTHFEILLSIDNDGYMSIWDLIEGNLKLKKKVSNGPLSCVTYSAENDIVIAAGKNYSEYQITCWKLDLEIPD